MASNRKKWVISDDEDDENAGNVPDFRELFKFIKAKETFQSQVNNSKNTETDSWYTPNEEIDASQVTVINSDSIDWSTPNEEIENSQVHEYAKDLNDKEIPIEIQKTNNSEINVRSEINKDKEITVPSEKRNLYTSKSKIDKFETLLIADKENDDQVSIVDKESRDSLIIPSQKEHGQLNTSNFDKNTRLSNSAKNSTDKAIVSNFQENLENSTISKDSEEEEIIIVDEDSEVNTRPESCQSIENSHVYEFAKDVNTKDILIKIQKIIDSEIKVRLEINNDKEAAQNKRRIHCTNKSENAKVQTLLISDEENDDQESIADKESRVDVIISSQKEHCQPNASDFDRKKRPSNSVKNSADRALILNFQENHENSTISKDSEEEIIIVEEDSESNIRPECCQSKGSLEYNKEEDIPEINCLNLEKNLNTHQQLISDEEDNLELVVCADFDLTEGTDAPAPKKSKSVKPCKSRRILLLSDNEKNWWEIFQEDVPENQRCKIQNCSFAPHPHKTHPIIERNYSLYEIRLIIKYLVHFDIIEFSKGLLVWENLHSMGYLKHRPVHSLRNHLQRYLLKDIKCHKLPKHIEDRFLRLQV